MNYEVEQKFPVANLAQLEHSLNELRATPGPVVEQIDQYYAHPAKDFAQSDEALRIRSVGDENFLTYKGPKLDATTKTRQEIEVSLEPGKYGLERFSELLSALGFRTVLEVRKVRRPFELRWQDRLVHAALDQVAGIGCFVELELVVGPEEVESAKACIANLAENLQLAQPERRSYLELLLETTGPSANTRE